MLKVRLLIRFHRTLCWHYADGDWIKCFLGKIVSFPMIRLFLLLNAFMTNKLKLY